MFGTTITILVGDLNYFRAGCINMESWDGNKEGCVWLRNDDDFTWPVSYVGTQYS